MIGRTLGNRYELLEKIGEGGMGLVYKAKCHLLNRYVAVKILKPELIDDEEFVNKFRKESLSAASLSHPNIVNIYDVGVEDGIYYIVMELVKGKTLKEIIHERAPMPFFEIINISRQICLALDHAHKNNIIHRDVKPQNILITHDGIVKVADFGIARASNSATLTNTGNVLGSVYYISPEQARGGFTDEKTDIYSLGTVIYEMATAKVPFVAESPVAIALKHIQDDITRPSELNSDIPLALEDIITNCLKKNPSERYESAAAVIKDLDIASANPEKRIARRIENSGDTTRVMPVINQELLNGKEQKTVNKKKKINRTFIVAFVIIFTVVTVSGLLLLNMYGNLSRNKDVPVPYILGLDENTAEQMLKSYNLNMEVIDRPNSDKPLGTVIKTYPDVGVDAKENGVVKVRISAGPVKVLIPNVIGESLNDAIFALEQKGLEKGGVIEVNDDNIEPGRVINVWPEVDKEVVYGTLVDIYVSKGPAVKFVKVPPLEGITLDKVEERLAQDNLKLGKADNGMDLNKPDNVVLNQSIPPMTEVKEGTVIDITVNKIIPSIPATH
ncbi:serine/threonine-protein kinase PrkC [Oxobacter pfennigii]|uniref:non-specific serine/threonine protein kinase n=1 Tax=Oxobacter pfennigii TaxID=36849 RepID=A0A0P9AF38_9CLOT|nr:Stk1 family PASTA domain-containing Ser/Thr kinase [Oxobacter pfennigii]KPU43973.1 serine/threonine-protein kinase PrkC [Oxobacter pfennigii]